jgi:hypothetical protein
MQSEAGGKRPKLYLRKRTGPSHPTPIGILRTPEYGTHHLQSLNRLDSYHLQSGLPPTTVSQNVKHNKRPGYYGENDHIVPGENF